MEKLEIIARSPEQALEKASTKLNLPAEELVIIEEYDPDDQDIKDLEGQEKENPELKIEGDPVLYIINASMEKTLGKIREWLEGMLQHFPESCRVEVITHEDSVTAVIHAEDPSILIGKQGQTLEALQHVTSRVLPRLIEGCPMVFLDVGDYREKRLEKLEEMADRAVDRALRTKRSVKLKPMGSQDRKYIHHYLKDVEKIETASYGGEPFRYIEIELPGEKNRGKSAKGDNKRGSSGREGKAGGRGKGRGRVTKKVYDDAAEKDEEGNYIYEREEQEAPKKKSLDELLTSLPEDSTDEPTTTGESSEDKSNDELIDELE